MNAMYSVTNGVATPDTRAIMLETIIVGSLPYVSESHPNINMPGTAPKKKAVWESAGIQASSQTQSKSVAMDL